MLRATKTAAVAVTAAAVVVAGTVTPAAADEDCVGLACPPDADAANEEGQVTIWLSGNGLTQEGERVVVPASQVTVRPPCIMTRSFSGEEYAEMWENDGAFTELLPHLPPEDRFDPWDDYEEYADVDGYWWTASCHPQYYHAEDPPYTEYAANFYAENRPVFVPDGDPPPEFDIPPEILAYYAYEAMDLPEVELAWNPQRDGDAATFVNLDTWVWLEGMPVVLDVTATAGGNSATVTATLAEMTATAPNADPAVCGGPGVPWTPGADDGCAIVFHRSSANQPTNTTTVSVDVTWTARWSTNGVDQGELDPQTVDDSFEVPVAEIQAIVSG